MRNATSLKKSFCLFICIVFCLPFSLFAQDTIVKTYYKQGKIVQIESETRYTNGYKNGIAKTYYPNGKIKTEEPWVNGKYNGVWKQYYENGKLKFAVPYKANKQNGISKSYYENGNIYYETPYVNDKENGVSKRYEDDGKLYSETPYTDGEKNGVEIYYDDDGKIEREIPYKDGSQNGVEKRYDKDGKLYQETPYLNGKEDGVYKYYFGSGKLKDEISYSEGKKNGTEKHYSEDGSMTAEAHYVDGKKNGADKTYYENGKVKYETPYTDGKINGVDKYYDEEGNLRRETTYTNGKQEKITVSEAAINSKKVNPDKPNPQINKQAPLSNTDAVSGGMVTEAHGLLGIRILDIDSNLIQEKHLNKNSKGVYVNEVIEGSAAYQAGMREGDIIIKLFDEKVFSTDQQKAIRKKHEGENEFKIVIIRANKEKVLSVKLNDTSQKETTTAKAEPDEEPEVILTKPKPTKNDEIIVSVKEMENNNYELIVEGNIQGYITGLAINYEEVPYNLKQTPSFSASVNIYEKEKLIIAWSDVNGVTAVSGYKIVFRNIPLKKDSKTDKDDSSFSSSDTDSVPEKPQYRSSGDPLKGLNISKTKEEVIIKDKYYALVIGIDKYSGVWNPLKNAVHDASAMKKLLSEKVKTDSIRTLYDSQATRKNIIKEFEWMIENVKENDNVLIYYSGHGEYKKTTDKGYWVPVDAQTTSISDYISNDDIQTFLSSIKSKHTLLISDACFSGDIFRGNTISIPFESTDKYYGKVYNMPSRQALTSGGNEPVLDSGKDGHSVFAFYLLKYLGEFNGKFLDASTLFNNLKIGVVNNSDQTPQLNGIKNTGDEGGQFIFIKK